KKIERDSRCPCFELCDSGLTRSEKFREGFLGEVSPQAVAAKALTEHELHFDDLSFLVGESKELSRRTELPARLLKFFPFGRVHGVPPRPTCRPRGGDGRLPPPPRASCRSS